MDDCAGGIYIRDGRPEALADYKEKDAGNKASVYEVIRVIDEVPLFFEDHFERLGRSARLLGESCKYSEEGIKTDIFRLVRANGLKNCNVKLIVTFGGGTDSYLLYISKSYYPPEEVYSRGVETDLLRLERQSPNIKLVNKSYKERVSSFISGGRLFEALLVDEMGNITEGSKSNVFFARGNSVVTAPGERVLKGITRKYVFLACERIGIRVIEENTSVASLDAIDGLFLSGTSIKVLPVSKVGPRSFDSSRNRVIGAVRREFDAILEEYVRLNKTFLV